MTIWFALALVAVSSAIGATIGCIVTTLYFVFAGVPRYRSTVSESRLPPATDYYEGLKS